SNFLSESQMFRVGLAVDQQRPIDITTVRPFPTRQRSEDNDRSICGRQSGQDLVESPIGLKRSPMSFVYSWPLLPHPRLETEDWIGLNRRLDSFGCRAGRIRGLTLDHCSADGLWGEREANITSDDLRVKERF